MAIEFTRKTQALLDQSTYRNIDHASFDYAVLSDGTAIGVIDRVREFSFLGFIDSGITSDEIKAVLMHAGSIYGESAFRLTVQDNPTFATKLGEICTQVNDDYVFTTETVIRDESLPLSNVHFGKIVLQNYRLNVNDDVVGAATYFGDVIITIPDITTLNPDVSGNFFWKVYKMTGDNHKVKVVLENPNQFFVKYSTRYLTKVGMGVEIGMYREGGKYWFRDVSTDASLERVVSMNLMPCLDGNQLIMKGAITDFAANSSVSFYFRYRANESEVWSTTEQVEVFAEGAVSSTVTVDADSYQTQLIVIDSMGYEFTTDILLIEDALPYYASREVALSDGMLRLWQMQEHTTTDEPGVDLIDGQDMTFYGGVTSGSDTVDTEVIYKRIFTGQAYGEAYLNIKSKRTYTFCVWINMNTTSGDHTIFSNGKNVLSLAADGDDIQLEVDGSIKTWSNCLPFSGFKILFVTVDPTADKTYLYDVTPSSATLCIDFHDTIKSKGIFMRLGKGSSGDSNHQDYEYMNDGSVRMLAVWDNVLSTTKMMDIATNLETGGLLLE